jgi:hypothetical protein
MKKSKTSRGKDSSRPAGTDLNEASNEQPNGGQVEVSISPAEVESRAYHHYLNQGSQHGHDVDHWLAAEKQLLSERQIG